MRVAAIFAVIGLLGLAAPVRAGVQGPAPAGPPFTEVEARWTDFWATVRRGDLEAARRAVHSRVRSEFRDGFPHTTSGESLPDMAQQMAYCRLDSTPMPISAEEVAYGVRCRHGTETAESLVILRQDADGVWRFTSP
jgi:hypothetical protein